MTGTVCTKVYAAPPVNAKEILRYAGARDGIHEIESLVADCLEECADRLVYKVCYAEFPVICEGAVVDLGFTRVTSSRLAKNLDGCDKAVLFAATVGIGLDRLIARYGVMTPSRALMLQAVGAERIEGLCDTFNREIKERYAAEGRATRPRFSPGYSDLPLSFQKDIFRVLDCGRKIGLTLNESLLMSPSKSVTAIIGVSKNIATGCEVSGCGACESNDCAYRR